MKKSALTLPEIALIASTRGLIGAGTGKLLADRLNNDRMKPSEDFTSYYYGIPRKAEDAKFGLY